MDNYYFKNIGKFKNYYAENREKKLEYQKEYSAKKQAIYNEMKEKLINYNIVIRPPTKKEVVGINLRHGEFTIDWD